MTAWPRVVDALVAILPTLPEWSGVPVFDGPPVTSSNPTTYCTVGYVEDDDAGSYERDERRSDYRVQETGEVRCHVVAQSGSTNDLPALRARVFALADAFEASVRADQSLGGVLSADGTTTVTASVRSVQNEQGAGQSLVLAVRYLTRE